MTGMQRGSQYIGSGSDLVLALICLTVACMAMLAMIKRWEKKGRSR